MTAYGFDLDGTITRQGLAQLANDLYDAGHKIYIITGGLNDIGEWTMQARTDYLAQLGVRYTEIVRCIDPDIRAIGLLKKAACQRLGVSVFFDDSVTYLEAMGSPDCVRLWVMPA